MTRSTRQTRANRSISAMVKRRIRQASRSASSGYLQPYPVPVLEEIRQRLCHAVHANGVSLDPMSLDAIGERTTAETHHAQRRVLERGRAHPTVGRDPYLGWKLRADPVEAERGYEANHASGHRPRHDGESVMLGDRPSHEPVLTARDPLDNAFGEEPGQLLAVDSATGRLEPPATVPRRRRRRRSRSRRVVSMCESVCAC